MIWKNYLHHQKQKHLNNKYVAAIFEIPILTYVLTHLKVKIEGKKGKNSPIFQ